MIYRHLSFLLLLLLLFSCTQEQPSTKGVQSSDVAENNTVQYAQNFSIEKKENYTILTVSNPWKDAKTAFTYIAYPREQEAPKGVKDATLIPTPIRSLACMSTTHVGLLSALGATDLITAMSGTKYVYNQKLQARIKSGEVKELGFGDGLNYEQLVETAPDVVLTYGMGEDNNIHKYKEVGLSPIVLAEYVDTSPLGRAEWIKFIAVLLGKEAMADQYFNSVAKEYEQLKTSAQQAKKQPTVFTGMGFQGNWHVPEADSYVAQSIADAAGNYLWKEKAGNASLELDFEAVYDKAIDAEVWINLGMVKSLADIKKADERYTGFTAWETGRAYNGSKRISEGGGYDIYETAVVEPHLVLRDLVKIFHPELIKEDLVYYEQLP